MQKRRSQNKVNRYPNSKTLGGSHIIGVHTDEDFH